MRRVVLLACVAYGCGPRDVEPPAPRHVLLVVVDTLRADHLSVYGHERPTSPNLDALAARGVLFERAYSQSSWTSPSMISMMTGRYVAEDRLAVPEGVATLAELFERDGWDTAAFIANELLSEENGFERGFDRVVRKPAYSENDPILEWLEGQAGKRTFTYVHLTEPHDPYRPPPETWHWLRDPPELTPERSRFYGELAAAGIGAGQAALREIRRGLAGYDDDVRFADRRIGAFLGALERTGQLAETAVVVASDHGEGLWTRLDYKSGPRTQAERRGETPTLLNTLKMTHGNQVYAELVHVPLILVAPGLTPAVVDEPVENVDLVPTLLELCDLPHPGDLAGTSLLRVLEAPESWGEHKPAAFSATRFASTVLTPDGWQLILPTPLGECQEGLAVELYDLERDPTARVNLAESHAERVAELSALVRERLAAGIRGDMHDVSASNLGALAGLGYLEGGILDTVREEFHDLAFEQLLGVLRDPSSPCLVRLQAARALDGRALEEREREELVELAAAEPSPAVRRVLEGL